MAAIFYHRKETHYLYIIYIKRTIHNFYECYNPVEIIKKTIYKLCAIIWYNTWLYLPTHKKAPHIRHQWFSITATPPSTPQVVDLVRGCAWCCHGNMVANPPPAPAGMMPTRRPIYKSMIQIHLWLSSPPGERSEGRGGRWKEGNKQFSCNNLLVVNLKFEKKAVMYFNSCQR